LKYFAFILSFIFVLSELTFGQIPKSFQPGSGWSSSLPRTNAVNDIVVRHDSIWFGTEHGLSLTTDNGKTWTNFSGTGTFDSKGISAFAIQNNLIWAATGYSTKLNDESIQTGGGLHFSTDRGTTWNYIPQPVDQGLIDTLMYGRNKIHALAIVVPQQNITFDIGLMKNSVWTASWAGMLRKSIDSGRTWQRVILPPDDLYHIDTSMTLDFDLSPVKKKFSSADSLIESNNHKLFSIYVCDDTTIWVGTAGGINKSIDGGLSWTRYAHQNQPEISGNFVVALCEQRWQSYRILWAATVDAGEGETKGISYTDDGGSTWHNALLGEWAHNIAVRDDVVYVATDNGLFRSSDFGRSWMKNGTIYDPTTLQRFVSSECYAVAAQGDTIWFGGPEGIAYTIDSPLTPFGSVWRIFRTAEQIGIENRTYAYPNPFAPDDEPARIHYSLGTHRSGISNVSIHLFNFAMQPVRALIQQAPRLNGQEYDEIWDGKDDTHSIVANGVYFYRVEASNQTARWGKILVIR
jgi:hypothetical protein